jgi:pilus assembly protein Flp/PilA
MFPWVERPESNDEDGASAVEYGLLVAGIAGLVVLIVFIFGGAIGGMFTDTCESVGTGSDGAMSCASS